MPWLNGKQEKERLLRKKEKKKEIKFHEQKLQEGRHGWGLLPTLFDGRGGNIMPKQYSLVYFRAREGENVEKRQRYHVLTNLIRTGAACQDVVPF